MDKNFFIAIALCVAIYVFFMKPPGTPQVPPAQEKTDPAGENDSTITKETSGSTVGSIADEQEQIESYRDEHYILQNGKEKVTIGSIGGRIIEVELLDYKLSKDGDRHVLIGYNKGDDYRNPLNWIFTIRDKDKAIRLRNLAFTVRDRSEKSVLLSYNYNDQLSFEKQLRLNDDYSIDEVITLNNLSDRTLQIGAENSLAYRADEGESKSSGFLSIMGAVPDVSSIVCDVAGAVEREQIEQLEGLKQFKGKVDWFGVDTKYFLSVIIPDAPTATDLQFEKLDRNGTIGRLTFDNRQIEGGGTFQYGSRLYIGPKEIDGLKALDNNLERTIDLGDWLGPIARPILHLLKVIQGFTFNYGIAIILLTILVKLILFPLNVKQYKSMKAMQKLQPDIKLLREKYKEGKEQLNVEMMNLFKRNKVNPMGGCLPLLLQMPIFFALYRVLFNSIELRHEPLAFWINDLSAPDRFFISPLLMGALMFVQQKMTPTTMDPTQAKIMMFMPLMFTVFMLALPSGLVLYILTNTAVSIAQQWYINKKVQV